MQSTDPPLPFANVKVFLQVRDSNDPQDKSKHEAKKCLKRLGAMLTFSLPDAHIVVFHNGSEALLQNAAALGKSVVTVQYLMDCKKHHARLPTSQYLVQMPGAAEPATEVKETKGVAAVDAKPLLAELERNPRPYLLDDDTVVLSQGLAASKPERGVGKLKGSAISSQSNNNPTAPIAATTVGQTKQRESPPVSTQQLTDAIAGIIGAPPLKGASPAQVVVTTSATPYLDKDTRPVAVAAEGNEGMNCSSSDPPIDAQSANDASKAKKRGRAQEKAVQPCDAKKKAPRTEKASNKGENEPPQSRAAVLLPVAAPKKTEAPHAPPAAAPLQEESDLRPISRAPRRVSTSGPDDEKGLVRDVIVALGAEFELRMFGRVPKPTHLVVLGDTVTPKVLLGRVLGIPLLNKEWINDSMMYGQFVEPLPRHFHSLHHQIGSGQPSSVERELTGSARKQYEALEHHRKELMGVDYKESPHSSVLAGCSLFLLGRSDNPPNDVYAELLRLLGATVARVLTPSLTAIVEVDGGIMRHGAKCSPREKEIIESTKVINAAWIVDVATNCTFIPMDRYLVDTSAAAVPLTPYFGVKGIASEALTLDPLAKTKQGPSNAVKYAANQMHTQQ